MNLKTEEAEVVASPLLLPSLGCSLLEQHGTGPEMSRVTHCTLPRWPGNALCGQRCGGNGARRNHLLPALKTAARLCRERSGSTKAKPHGNIPRQRQMDRQLKMQYY